MIKLQIGNIIKLQEKTHVDSQFKVILHKLQWLLQWWVYIYFIIHAITAEVMQKKQNNVTS